MTPDPDFWMEHALLPGGWSEAVRVSVDGRGFIREVAPGATPAGEQVLRGPTLPGMPNVHSHAFQAAMAGLAERGGGNGNFWDWREVMYRFALALSPEDLEAVTAWAFMRMLLGGFTEAGEFHYIHHDRDGRPYSDPAELSLRVLEAARTAGIRLFLLPVFYAHGNFGGAPAEAGQRRFLHDLDGYMDLVLRMRKEIAELPGARLGIAPHSLRAVTPRQLAAAVEACRRIDPGTAVHIHLSEQRKEVEDCLSATGMRPGELLMDTVPVDGRTCLVHATHLEGGEIASLAKSGAVAGVCPVTEGNLGDGIFPGVEWLGAGGRFALGTDSNILIDASEELRWLEYGQRLRHERRNVLGEPGRSTGRTLFEGALSGGGAVLGGGPRGIAPGAPADWVTLDGEDALIRCRTGDGWIDAWVFASDSNPVRHVAVAGRLLVVDGRHRDQERIERAADAALRRLSAEG